MDLVNDTKKGKTNHHKMLSKIHSLFPVTARKLVFHGVNFEKWIIPQQGINPDLRELKVKFRVALTL